MPTEMLKRGMFSIITAALIFDVWCCFPNERAVSFRCLLSRGAQATAEVHVLE